MGAFISVFDLGSMKVGSNSVESYTIECASSSSLVIVIFVPGLTLISDGLYAKFFI